MLTILGEAERFGAVLLNGAEVTEILDQDGRAAGVAFTEAESGERLEVQATNVVNATGVWADRIRPDEILTEEEIPRIAPSRGTHITLSTDDLPVGEAAFVVPAGEERTVMVLPWYGRAMIGPTDNDYDGDIDHVPPSDDDVAYLLDAANEYLELELTPDHVTGAFAGVRPLISAGDPKKSVDISRKAELYETSSGMLTITGGKLTTWRRMAELVVDRIVGARRPRGGVAHRRHPAGHAGPRRGPGDQRDPARGRRRAARLPLRARRAAGAGPGRGRPRAWPSRSCPATPTCWPRS